MIKQGNYVLATKYEDGDPQDQWCVGFYDGAVDGRHFVVDSNGNQFRANGFRRVAKISRARGEWLLNNKDTIETIGQSLWDIAP